MNKNLHYITFQSFPMFSANTIVTMKMLKYFKKKEYDVSLIFPGRNKVKSSEEEILKFYGVSEKININRTNYLLPFGKINFFNKSSFRISHFLWSVFIWLKYKFNNVDYKNTILLTRSSWVLYFFSFSKYKIVFECHKFSKLTKYILKLLRKKYNCGYTFSNELLKNCFELSKIQENNTIIAPSAYDEDEFNKKQHIKNENEVIFVGRFTRFNKDRNLDFLIEAFSKEELQTYKLKLIGGPKKIAEQLRSTIEEKNVNNITVLDYMPQAQLIQTLSKSEIGILINSAGDRHSRMHTSPVKYFEYIRAGLKVLAIDFESHRALPYSKQIFYFDEGNLTSFINGLSTLSKKNSMKYSNINKYSYDSKVNSIDNLFARLEGLEPPTL